MYRARAPADDPQAELLRLIEQLEHEYDRLRDVDAQVSAEGRERLRKLRVYLERAGRSQSADLASGLRMAVLAELAVEAIRLLFSAVTSFYRQGKSLWQFRANDSWRRYSDPPRICRFQTDGVGRSCGSLSLFNFAGRVRAA